MSYALTILADTPLIYYRLGDSGAAIADSSGNGNDGTATGSVTYGVAGAIVGDADTAIYYGSLDSDSRPFATADCTIEFWAKFDVVAGGRFVGGLYPDDKAFSVNGSNGLDFAVMDTGNNFSFATTGSLTAGSSWYHLVGTVESDGVGGCTSKVYVNGVLTDTQGLALPSYNGEVQGVRIGTDDYYGFVSYDEFAAYDHALSAGTILAHYNEGAGVGGLPLSPGVLAATSHDSTSATFVWSDAAGGTAPYTYQLQRSPSGAGTWTNVVGVVASPGTDTTASPSTAYDYRVAVTDGAAAVDYTNTVAVTTDAALTAGVLTKTAQSATSATFSWTAGTFGTGAITGTLQRSAHSAGSYTNIGTAHSGATSGVSSTGLTPATAYDFRVHYADSVGGAYSSIVVVTTSSLPTGGSIMSLSLKIKKG